MAGEDRIWIVRNYEKCSGCRRCEIACSLHHEGRIWPEASRIRVFMLIPGVEIPHLCFQCEDYPCVEACPAGALSVNSRTGGVEVDSSKCTGCGICVNTCPARVPHMHPGRNTVVICNLCGGEPVCVKECAAGKWNALELVPAGSVAARRPLAKTPDELTRETALRLLGEEVAREVLG